MNIKQLSIAKLLLLTLLTLSVISCNDDNDNPSKEEIGKGKENDNNSSKDNYFVGMQIELYNEVIVPTQDLTTGTISAQNNGIAQEGWLLYFSHNNKIFAGDYNANNMITSYGLKDGKLKKLKSVTTDKQVFGNTKADDKTLILVGSDFKGLSQEIYIVDTDEMAITKKAKITLESNEKEDLGSMPTDLVLQGDKLFLSFHNINVSNARTVHLPHANTAKVAVFNYPELTLEKIITDSRCPNVGRYASTTVLEQDENGDIYTYSPSSIFSGFVPIPPTNSGVLRIRKGTTEFDKDFHIDFEKISNGYKINDLYYVANGKAVVRVVKEDESFLTSSMEAMKKYAWAAYTPTLEKELAQVYTGILDLNTKSFKLLENVAPSGGSFDAPLLVEGNKAYVGVSTKSYADIYVIDVEKETATKGAKIEGEYAKSIFKINN